MAKVTNTKPWWDSKTIRFMVAVAAAGGLDLINQWINAGATDWRSIALLCTGLAGIALRLLTYEPLGQ